MTTKNGKSSRRQTSTSDKTKDAASEIRKLKKRITELQRKLKSVQGERDAYLRVTHAYLRLTEDPKDLTSGFDEEFIEGSVVDFLKRSHREHKLKNGNGHRAS